MSARQTLASLVDADSLGKVTVAFEAIIARSFEKDRELAPHSPSSMKAAEVKRRFEICCAIFCALRGDLQWGLERVFAHLPEYLRCELDGKAWEPNKRQCWVPGDGT